ncbi:MAG: hypothetical protein EHM13_13195 [Acidobacteria bacterium]|nr:MAG: hypothetical protein EHM13_13195 [Acidobacteriota bacterium]
MSEAFDRIGCRTLVGLLILTALAVRTGATEEAADKGLSKEISRVQGEAVRVLPEDRRSAVVTRLERAAAAVDARRLYLALYELESAFEVTHAQAFAKKSATVKTPADCPVLWRSAGEPRIRGGAANRMIVRALASSAESRAGPTYRASLPYAQDAGVAAGLYYLGESQAFVAFADFARSLAWPPAGQAPPLRSLAPELEALDAEVTRAYEQMTEEEHPTYVVTSVTLKRARTLNDSGKHAGALLEYLLARYRFAMLRPDAVAEAPRPQRLDVERARLDDGIDHSIARMFVEMAEAALASDDARTRRSATAIVEDVLPAYHAALREVRPQASVGDANAPRVVTVTLVRWPFT